jgi:transcriptional regulator with XRE-family HTH domain
MAINRIRALRQARGLTLQDVADALGVTVQMVSRWELGTRPLRLASIQKIARVLGVPPGALFPDEAPDANKVVQGSIQLGTKVRLADDEVNLVTFWRMLDPGEKQMFASFARAKGLEILAADEPEPRRRRAGAAMAN